MPGASNDRGLLQASGLEDRLAEMFGGDPRRPTFHLYGDSGYDGSGRTIFSPDDLDVADMRTSANSVLVSLDNVFGWEKGGLMCTASFRH